MDGSLLLAKIFTIILSPDNHVWVPTTALYLTSTGVVLFVCHPIIFGSDVNTVVITPAEYFCTWKYAVTLSLILFFVKYKYACHKPLGIISALGVLTSVINCSTNTFCWLFVKLITFDCCGDVVVNDPN